MLKQTGIICLSLILISITGFAQTMNKNKYDALWKRTDSLVTKKGLTKSALTEVKKIYALAKAEKQDGQLIKALVYQIGLEETLQEDNDSKSFTLLEKEVRENNGAAKYILQTILADKYYYYLGQHRYNLYDRTNTTAFKKEDVATWTIDDFHKKITSLYLASLKDRKTLQQTKLAAYDPIIVKGNVRYLRPTLYDLLAHHALEYFQSGENEITKAANAFEINEAAAFEPAADFIKHRFNTNDSTSLQQKALLIYQEILQFHIDDAKPDAFIDADILRLQFVYGKAVMENKEELYRMALNHIAKQYPKYPAAAQASYLLAETYRIAAAKYNPLKDTTNRFEYIKAKQICEEVLIQKDSSEGFVNCYNLLQLINQQQLTLTTEKVNIPGQPFRSLVSYRNITQLNLQVIALTEELEQKIVNRYDENYWQSLVKLSPLKKWQQALPATNDYQTHSAEIKIDALPAGKYILLSSGKEDFSLQNNPLAVQFFYVSNISYVNNGSNYFVLNRETGQPLANAAVQLWNNQYDYKTSKYQLKKLDKLNADKNGYFSTAAIKRNNNDRNFRLDISYEKDRLFMSDDYYIPYTNDNAIKITDAAAFEKTNAKVFFFTDRSIYRPGQTMYFKGIAITQDMETRKSKLYTGMATIVYLYNANQEKADSISVTTNEYGSYSGKFKLPEGVLNGEFYIADETLNGTSYFSVEEYKRPKFYVEYETVKGTYTVNDSITVKGNAKAFAGNNIDGAKITYRVQRVARFIYPWLYWKIGYPRGSNAEITHGELKTNADGSFNITFKAIPDASVSRELEPVFDYKVTADVTDINGETRSGETTISVSYKSLQLTIGVPEILPADSLKTISITTKNMNGQFEPSLVYCTVYSLVPPERLIRKRFWEQPDQFTMAKEEFIAAFPHDEYNNEADYHNWQRGNIVLRKNDSTASTGVFELPNSKLGEGWYVIEVSTRDKNGETVKDIQYINLYDQKSNSIPVTAYLWGTNTKNSNEPGDTSRIAIGSSAKDIYVIQQIAKAGQDDKTGANNFSYLKLSAEKKTIPFVITEIERGGFGVYHFFVKDNRFYSMDNTIMVPWSNKDLQITYETFRDKTLPGSEEKWKLKISGTKGEKVAAEMLASMYDASLDEFRSHSWSKPNIWDVYLNSNNWVGNSCFNLVHSQPKYQRQDKVFNNKLYDQIVSIQNEYSRENLFEVSKSDMFVRGDVMGKTDIAAKANLAKGRKMAVEDTRSNKIIYDLNDSDGVTDGLDKEKSKGNSTASLQIRKNFNETAFFFPDLKTDKDGNIEFGFTIPEALTKWKFQSLAHTKDLAFGYSSSTVITQKPLMVQPNAPRFLREGDKMELSAKVVNLTDKEITGTVQLDLQNAATGESVSGWFRNMYPTQYFTADAGQSTVVKFSIDIPYQYNSAVQYRFVAQAGDNSDGEEAAIPVLSNSMLVTESMPLPMRGKAPKHFRFEKLLQSGNSETLQQHALTVEFTTNPAWYAVQALPYLMEYPYECAEQTFNRYYANAIATKVANASPKLKAVFEKWKTSDTSAMLSNLQKNPELKSILLEETPWVLDAKNEAKQKKNIALLFDMMRMSAELNASYEKLRQLQSENGGFVWFKGGPDDRYMTQYIVTGIGHLKKLGALTAAQQQQWNEVIKNAVAYLDNQVVKDYKQLLKHKADLKKNNLSYTDIQYLYMRSFFSNIAIPAASLTAVNYYTQESKQYWLQQSRYMQGMMALYLSRKGDIKTANDIIRSLKQNAINNEELGMYWKDNTGGYYWHQAPVETQSLLIEAFAEISKDNQTVDNLKTWLLKQKQVHDWKTTKATAEACYALLLQGSDWLNNTPEVEINLGDKTVSSTSEKQEAGTGYFKKTIDGPFVNPAMGDITIKISSDNNNSSASWGAVYWQYFEQLDKITGASTPLKLNKKLFVEKLTDKGPVLTPVNENDYLKVGDKIKVRIELRVDRDMEYVHMKDMRGACMEPINVLSEYKWQGGLSYYESTKDASTNFFFNELPKGVYVFEYTLFVTHTGNFSNGVTTIQCMYAPEFSSHSEGVRVNVE